MLKFYTMNFVGTHSIKYYLLDNLFVYIFVNEMMVITEWTINIQ